MAVVPLAELLSGNPVGPEGCEDVGVPHFSGEGEPALLGETPSSDEHGVVRRELRQEGLDMVGDEVMVEIGGGEVGRELPHGAGWVGGWVGAGEVDHHLVEPGEASSGAWVMVALLPCLAPGSGEKGVHVFGGDQEVRQPGEVGVVPADQLRQLVAVAFGGAGREVGTVRIAGSSGSHVPFDLEYLFPGD